MHYIIVLAMICTMDYLASCYTMTYDMMLLFRWPALLRRSPSSRVRRRSITCITVSISIMSIIIRIIIISSSSRSSSGSSSTTTTTATILGVL